VLHRYTDRPLSWSAQLRSHLRSGDRSALLFYRHPASVLNASFRLRPKRRSLTTPVSASVASGAVWFVLFSKPPHFASLRSVVRPGERASALTACASRPFVPRSPGGILHRASSLRRIHAPLAQGSFSGWRHRAGKLRRHPVVASLSQVSTTKARLGRLQRGE